MPDVLLTTATPLTQDGTSALIESARIWAPGLETHVVTSGEPSLPEGVLRHAAVENTGGSRVVLASTHSPEAQASFALPFVARHLVGLGHRVVIVTPGCLVAAPFAEVDALLDERPFVTVAPMLGGEKHTLTPELHTLTRRTATLSDRVVACGPGSEPILARWCATVEETLLDVYQRTPADVVLSLFASLIGDPLVAVAGRSTLTSWVEHAAVASGRAAGELTSVIEADRLIAMARSAAAVTDANEDEVEVAWQLLADNVHDSRPLEPFVEVLAHAVADHPIPKDATTPFDVLVRDLRRAADPFGARWPEGTGDAAFLDWLYQRNAASVTRVAHLLWRRREDLWGRVPSPLRDPGPLRKWAASGGTWDLGADPFDASVTPVEPVEPTESGRLGTALAWRANLLAGLTPGYDVRQRRKLVRHGPEPVKGRGVAAPRRVAVDRMPDHFGPSPRQLSVIGCFRAESGLGQAARASLGALRLLDRDFSWIDTSEQYPSRNAVDPGLDDKPFGAFGDVNLLHSNADELITLNQQVFRDRIAGRFNAAMWFWETADLPERSLPAFDAVDELWVASEYLVDVFGQYGHVPVVNIGLAADLPDAREVARSEFDLPEEPLIFLFVYDALSSHGRKNPEKTLEAYVKAFAPHFEGVHFVLKVSNLNKFPASQKRIMSVVDRYPGAITLIDEYLPRARVMDLMSTADVYVSLHAAEGYGLTLLEAMALGTPTICTAYSGNMDFTTAANSWLVDFEMMATDAPTGPYPPGSVWASPNTDSAADTMRSIAADRSQVAGKRQRAMDDAREAASLERYAERLDAQLRRVL